MALSSLALDLNWNQQKVSFTIENQSGHPLKISMQAQSFTQHLCSLKQDEKVTIQATSLENVEIWSELPNGLVRTAASVANQTLMIRENAGKNGLECAIKAN